MGTVNTRNGEGVPNIVIPTIRSEGVFGKFLSDWGKEFSGCHLIVVEDRGVNKLTELMKFHSKNDNFTYQLINHKDIDRDLGEDAWIIPRKTDCVRSYGYLLAQRNNPLFIITLDDDVSPQVNHIATFYTKLFTETYPAHDVYNTMKGVLPRGTYLGSPGCEVVHGVWANVPDFSAEEHSTKLNYESDINSFNEGIIPKGSVASICGMNLAWKPEVTKYMYFGLQGGDYPIDRCGDIWCGYRLCEHNIKIYTGRPMCTHNKASNLWANMKKEKNAEVLSKCFINGLPLIGYEDYEDKLVEAEVIWERLVDERTSRG